MLICASVVYCRSSETNLDQCIFIKDALVQHMSFFSDLIMFVEGEKNSSQNQIAKLKYVSRTETVEHCKQFKFQTTYPVDSE